MAANRAMFFEIVASRPESPMKYLENSAIIGPGQHVLQFVVGDEARSVAPRQNGEAPSRRAIDRLPAHPS